ncbi:MAG: HDOD domain-containing protein [Nitrospiraceae bacterium]|nr:MAG: HDOD domain-containing protein [Nitrospiraceae bacterium]
MKRNKSLNIHVQKIPALPTLPVVAQEILMLLDDDLVSINKLENIIENDPAIAARILSLANSAFWKTAPVRTLGEAIFRIGFNGVRYLAVGISLMTLFDAGKNKVAYQKIYNHSVAAGFVSKMLSEHLRTGISDEIWISGMLHDLGIMVLNRYFSDSYSKVLKMLENGTPLLEAEREALDFTHAEIGSWLAEEWNLPGTTIQATLYHHEPSAAVEYVGHVAVVHIADYLTARYVLSPTAHDPRYPFEADSLAIIGLSDEDMKDIEMQIQKGELFRKLFQ